jgi:ribonuclease J
MSSSIIPGNEKVVANVIHNLHFLGASVNFSNPNSVLHVSGHSYSGDLSETIKKLNPTYLIPMHGNSIMLNAHKKIAEKSGVKEKNIYVLNNGDQLEINKNKIKKIESINLTDEIVLRNNNFYKTEENLNIKIKNKNIISILYFIDKDDYSKKYETQISISNPSRKNQITKFISNSLESNKELLSIIKSTISWEEKTRILNEKLYKLVLLEFNKDYSIKLILIEK